VPTRSAMLGTEFGGTTPGADRPVHRVCGVNHVPLGGDPATMRRLVPYLTTGTPVDPDADATSCPSDGWLVEIDDIDDFTPSRRTARAARAAPMTLTEAEADPGLTVLRIGRKAFVIVPGSRELTLSLDTPGARVTVTAVNGESVGTVTRFPALTGTQTLELAPGTAPQIPGLTPSTPTGGGGGASSGGGGGGSTPSTTPPAPTTDAEAAPTASPTPPATTPNPIPRAADRQAPRTTIRVQRLRNGRVRVTLRARDGAGGTGVRTTHYRIGSGPTRTYRSPLTLRRAQLPQLRAWSVDRAGNRERTRRVSR
jgi:hypothetical protein